MPFALVSAPPHQDSGIIPVALYRTQTPPGISTPAEPVDDQAQQTSKMCDTDLGDVGDWDDDIGWDEEEDDMPDTGPQKMNGKLNHGQRLIAVEGAVGKLDAKVEEQGKVLVMVDSRTAQILTALQQGSVVMTSPTDPSGPNKLPVVPPQPHGHSTAITQLTQLFNTFGPWGIVLWLILTKG